jgi:alpha-mannosidase
MSAHANGLDRRSFILKGTAALSMVAAAPLLAQSLNEGSHRRKVVHIIGHSHIDAAWLWPWRDGADTVLTTMRSALNRMNETPGFCYSHSSAAHYRWVQRADPAMFEEIRQRIREGRWEVVGGWPVEPDCNIPSSESLVRHSLYGKDYCRQALGVDVKIGFNPDSFGHAAGLPTILSHAGYDSYVFMRPQEHEMNLPLLFWWEGPDGSRILAMRIYKEYSAPSSAIPSAVLHDFAPGMDHAAFFLGVGDHGGAVTIEQIHQVEEMQKDPGLPELRWSTVGNYLAAVRESEAIASLPVVKGELQHHSRGCYSAYGEGKFLNRRAERWMGEAESISLVANISANHPYPGKEFADAWWKVLFCQFHDMLAGTSLYSDYQDVRDSVGFACETAQTSKIEALEVMAKRVDLSSVKESAVFLFNPLPWSRKALVEYNTEKNLSGKGPITCLATEEGTRIPLQWRPPASMTSDSMRRLSAWVELPPCGYKVLELAHGEPPVGASYSGRFVVSETSFGLSSMKAEDGTELLTGSLGLVAIGDTADTWAHGIREFREEMGRPMLISSTVVEDGPVTRVTRQRARWMDSEIVLDVAQFAGIEGVELRFVIDWHQHEQMLKLEIPTAVMQPRVFAKVPGDILERHTNGEEEPYQDWAAVQGGIANDDYTIGLLNNSTYSYDCLNGLFRTVLIRSAPFARHNPNQVPHNDNNAWQDQGRQERRFWIMCGKGQYTQFALDRLAEEFQTPAEYVIDSAHAGHEPRERSFLEVQPSNVWVMAVKRAEHDQDCIIVRLQERAGSACKAKLVSAPFGFDSTVSLAPWELKTLLINPSKSGKAKLKEVSLLES